MDRAETQRIRGNMKLLYGGVKGFCRDNALSYHTVSMALKRGDDKYILMLPEEVTSDLESVLKKEDDKRAVLKKGIIEKYKNLSRFSEETGVEYMKVWRYLKGETILYPPGLIPEPLIKNLAKIKL
jgi:DNA-binding phage protein